MTTDNSDVEWATVLGYTQSKPFQRELKPSIDLVYAERVILRVHKSILVMNSGNTWTVGIQFVCTMEHRIIK